MTKISTGRTALYRLFDAKNVLLYVGVSTNPRQRWALHESTQPWWGEVSVREFEWYPSRAEALKAEATAIAEEGPRWNKNGGQPAKRSASGGYWSPDEAFKTLIRRYRRAEAASNAARAALEKAIVRAFRGGASAKALAAHVPWPDKTIYALAKSHGVARLREPTVVRLRREVPGTGQ